MTGNKLLFASLLGLAGMGVAPAETERKERPTHAPQSENDRLLAPVSTLHLLALGDYDGDGDADLNDFAHWAPCMTGPGKGPLPEGCEPFDFEGDDDVDLSDARGFQLVFGPRKALLHDSCTSPAPVHDGETAFSNEGATTDGPDEPISCNFFSYSHIGSDIWFCYEATCTDEVVVSLCGSEYDTKMAVYSGCGCPAAPPIACSDDDCGGTSFHSRVTFQAQTGQSYLIRIGGYDGAQGSGILNILCGVEVCGPGHGDCFQANGTRGCEDVTCCSSTCAEDPFCCDVEWDAFCGCEAWGYCSGHFVACAPGAGSCSTSNGSPGCDDLECCDTVCLVDPFCCCETWDSICAGEAAYMCVP